MLTNGDRLSGALVQRADGALTFDSPLLGRLVVPERAVETFSAPPEFEAAASPPADEPAWEGELTAGMDIERGNSFKTEAGAGIHAVRETEQNRVRVEASYQGERTRNEATRVSTTTKRDLALLLRYDRFMSEVFYWYGSSEAERDGPKDLDLRFMGGAGFGYRWFDTDELKLEGDAGLSWIRESYRESALDDDFVASVLTWTLERRLPSLMSDRLTLFHQGKFWLDLEDWDDRLFSRLTTGVRSDLTPGTFLELKLVWEYDAEPSRDKKRQDVEYIFGMGHRF